MTELLSIVVVLLAAALVVTFVLHRLKAPTLIGYIVTGVLLGPTGLGLLQASPSLDLLAEIGVAFLMFYVGLEFSLPVLLASRRAVFGIGGAQVVLTGALGAFVGYMLGLAIFPAFLVGGAVAMSSTAITIRQLTDQGELDAPHGRTSVGTLLFQDIATLPFLVLIAVLGVGTHGNDHRETGDVSGVASEVAEAISGLGLGIWGELGIRLLMAGLAFALVLLVGRRVLVRAVAFVHATKSRELFMLAMLLIVLGAAYGAHEIGLSPPLGAFLAGMILGETDFKKDAETDIRPFRDVLLGLFFVSVGLQVDALLILGSGFIVIAVLAGLIAGKALILFAIACLFGQKMEVAMRTAIILAHGGEFGLLILTLALAQGVVPPAIGQPLIGAILLSMIFAPVLIKANRRLSAAISLVNS